MNRFISYHEPPRYKGFGGMNGALLATSKSLISSALDWKARLGGGVLTQAPHWIDARALPQKAHVFFAVSKPPLSYVVCILSC